VFGIDAGRLAEAFDDDPAIVGVESLAPERLHAELARRRVYLHPFRWTSLGPSLIEAMHLGMPGVALATTEAVRTVTAGTGVVSTDVDDLRRAARALLEEPECAREVGARARGHALTHYGLPAFLARWDEVLLEAIAARPGRGVVYANANSGGNATTTIAAHAR
jgi:glycosyltransferase involved in cell wall biosynthesis